MPSWVVKRSCGVVLLAGLVSQRQLLTMAPGCCTCVWPTIKTWYSPNATDSTKHQIDHVLFRRRDIKAVQDTRIFRGADIESDHRLMVCKLRLKSQPNIDSILAYSLLPFTVKQARKHSN